MFASMAGPACSEQCENALQASANGWTAQIELFCVFALAKMNTAAPGSLCLGCYSLDCLPHDLQPSVNSERLLPHSCDINTACLPPALQITWHKAAGALLPSKCQCH